MKTVLIVEDEKLIRQGLRKMIQRSGVPVEVIMECNNGETALEIVHRCHVYGYPYAKDGRNRAGGAHAGM